MPETIVTRFAAPDDLEWIVRMIHELAAYEHCSRWCEATPEGLRDYVFGERPLVEVLIAECDGQRAGMAMFLPTFAAYVCRPGLFLESLVVEPAFRRRGIGRALMTRLAAIALERGWGRMEWWVHRGNRETIRFYESLGGWSAHPWEAYWMFPDGMEALARGEGEA